ncbi:hypothetical protein DRN69_09480 [Candidatus Pacearchaeota archaeon]|nr:MAG: hypothetical protein DRN69_09480 [Candidatus Pacearchaeota archaeon]
MLDKEKEFEKIFIQFQQFIMANIHKFDLPKKGIDPEDILQEVKIKLWKIVKNEKNIANLPSYIRKIINSSIIDYIRRRRKEEEILNKEKEIRISEADEIYKKSKLEIEEAKTILYEALDNLIESRKRVVKLFLLNISLDEISVILKQTRDKTRNLLYRGLNDLKKILHEKGIEYED